MQNAKSTDGVENAESNSNDCCTDFARESNDENATLLKIIDGSRSFDARPESPLVFDERLHMLDVAVSKHPLNREILYKILAHCEKGLRLAEVEDLIASFPEFATSTQNQYCLLEMLVDAGGLDRFAIDGEGEIISETRLLGLPEDEIDSIVDDSLYVTSSTGAAFVELHKPRARLIEMLSLAPERTSTYADVLAFVQDSPRTYQDIVDLLAGRSELQIIVDGKREAMQPSVFVDKLERSGALIWKKGWCLTEEGEEFLKELRSDE